MPTTFKAAVTKYLGASTAAHGTRAEYQTTLTKWMEWGGGVSLEQLGRTEIREFLDAPALTAATVGIAFGHSTEVASEAARVVILDSSLERTDELLHIGRRMGSIAFESAVGGMALNLIGMLIAAASYLPPVAGAISQEVIDVLAVLNALRASVVPKVLSDYDQRHDQEQTLSLVWFNLVIGSAADARGAGNRQFSRSQIWCSKLSCAIVPSQRYCSQAGFNSMTRPIASTTEPLMSLSHRPCDSCILRCDKVTTAIATMIASSSM